MRAAFFLLVACLAVAGCGEPEDSADTPAAIQETGPATGADESSEIPSPPADEPAPADIAAPEQNPLLPLLEQDLPYGEADDGNLVGFLAVPEDAAEPLPGVIVLHEWWGLNDTIRNVSRRIAREGYIVLAVDLFGGRTASNVSEAQALMRELVGMPDAVRDNIRQAYEYLERYALAPRIGTIGWDLGGRWSLQTALMMPMALDAAVIFYGSVETDEAVLSDLQMPILGLFGEQDASVPLRSVQEFRNELGRLGKQAEIRVYSGVDHGFFFPGSPNYSPIAADDAWMRAIALLDSALKN